MKNEHDKATNKYGIINRQGNWVIPPKYESLGCFEENNLTGAMLNGKYGMKNGLEEWVIEPKFEDIPFFGEQDHAILYSNQKKGIIDLKGNHMLTSRTWLTLVYLVYTFITL